MSVGICPECVHQILARFVEVATTIGNSRNVGNNQTVRPVTITVISTVVHGVLHGPQGFYTIFILRFRAEVVVEIRFQPVAACRHDGIVRVLHYFHQVFCAEACHFVAVCIILMISFVQISLCQIGSCCGFGGTTFVCLLHGKVIISKQEIVCNLLPAFVIVVSSVGEIVVFFR